MKKLLVLLVVATITIVADAWAQPWEPIQVGMAATDSQFFGPVGRRIFSHDCGTQICWRAGHFYNSAVYYNIVDSAGVAFFGGGGCPVSFGFDESPTIWSKDGRAVITYRDSFHNNIIASTDAGCGWCYFDYFNIPTPSWGYIGPKMSGRQIILHRVDKHEVIHSSDEGMNWNTVYSDFSNYIFATTIKSEYSEKAAVVVAVGSSNIYFVESEDGGNWDYEMGKYINVPQNLVPDFDAIYDMDGNLHIVWVTYFQQDGAQIWHWSDFTQSLVYNASYQAYGGPPVRHLSTTSNGANLIAVAWANFNAQDTSVKGISNGDIYLATSTNNGATWGVAQNVTNTHSSGCSAGECLSEDSPSLAAEADTLLHLTFVLDRDAGAYPSYGEETDNAFLYQPMSVSELTGINEDKSIPLEFNLSQNYPNPFNATTTISYELATDGYANLSVYNLRGERVATLVDGHLEAGQHSVAWWNASMHSSGIYFYRLSKGGESITKRMTFLK